MKKTVVQVMFIHPLRHHLYPAIEAVAQEKLRTAFVTLFYRTGIFEELLSRVPLKSARKLASYHALGIPPASVISPLHWKLRRILNKGSLVALIADFDRWCANKIQNGELVADAYHLVQDYLPQTREAAHKRGAQVVIDQISNRSPSVELRIARNLAEYGFHTSVKLSDPSNEIVLSNREYDEHVLVPSEYVREGVSETCSSNTKILKIPYGTDICRFKFTDENRQDIRPGVVRLLVRANALRKGAHLFLFALAEYASQINLALDGAKLEIVVLGRFSDVLGPLVTKAKLALPATISIQDLEVPHVEMPHFYRSFDLFMMTSLTEGMSLAAVEAAASGLPLLLTNQCGIDRFIDGVHGFGISEHTSEAVADALIKALSERNNWRAISRNARLMAETYSTEQYKRNIASFYRSLLHA